MISAGSLIKYATSHFLYGRFSVAASDTYKLALEPVSPMRSELT
jgi:hypothetical protein